MRLVCASTSAAMLSVLCDADISLLYVVVRATSVVVDKQAQYFCEKLLSLLHA
jgi:hypothetical protein